MVFARQVRKSFGSTEVLKGIDLNVPAGSVACIIGPSGSGKSTFLTVINSYEHLQYWFDAGFYLRFDDWIFLFPVAYTVLLLWIIERGVTPDEYPRLSAVAFLLVFGLTFFHPHYAIWLVPFLALTIAWPFSDRYRVTNLHSAEPMGGTPFVNRNRGREIGYSPVFTGSISGATPSTASPFTPRSR